MLRNNEDLVGGSPVRNLSESLSFKTGDIHTIAGGVSVAWLMKAFRMGRAKVERKLIGCQPIGTGKHGVPLYDLPDAASYLVNPRIQLKDYLKEIKPEELPERLRETFWNAMLKQQRWEEKAGNLWRTDKVLSVFSEVLQEIRTRLQLIPEDIERAAGLSDKQHRAVTEIVDSVQDEIHKWIVDFASGGRTLNQLGEEGLGRDERDNEDLI